MSYPQRPPSASNDPTNPSTHSNNATSSQQQTHHPSTSSQHSINQPSSQGQAQSPIDWSNFMNFSTPPVHNAGPLGNGMRSNSGSSGPSQQQNAYGMSHQESRGDMGMGGNNNNNGAGGVEDETYQAFAQGIAMSRPSPSQISFRQPLAHRQSSSHLHSQQQSQSQPNQAYTQPSPLQHNLSLAPNNSQAGPSRSPGKGKSPADQNAPQSQSEQQQQDNTGLTLDADAFTRDIRFQVPQFLSNQVGGAPTFPPGGEAWSGFGPNMFSNDGSGTQQLTPGSMFNNAFGLTSDGSSSFGNNDQNALNGFMGDDAWTGWDKDDGSNGMSQNVPTTFYVNPNPSPSILSNRPQQQHVSQPQQQSMQPPTQQMQQSSFQQPSRSNATSRQNMGNLQVNTSQQSHQNGGIPVSPHTSTAHPSGSPRVGNNSLKRSAASMVSPHSSTSSSMPTSAIFPQQTNKGQTTSGPTSYYVPTVTAPTAATQTASTINIASSSTQPYAPPPNTAALLSGPALPNIVGPSLSDGPGLYSTTGFDMVGVLGRVAARKDPKTVLGPVDLSCSFIVVDIRRYDSPIVYASPTFEALTGYDLPQILGRNCRFLQSPEGEVVKGSKRKYTDNVAVAHLKRMLNAGKECQASLINYRRGGIPFINLVTVVPIPWDGTDIVYHVGFQVDLVEQPNAILRNMRDGTYQVNYTVGNPPPPVLRPPVNQSGLGLSQEVLDILGPRINTPGFGQGEEGGKMEWLKMVLENADDFVHVLSLKGLFQYVSPGVRRVLEYEPEDLLNKNISDICHPSDIVPLMRELKDSTHAPADGNTAGKVHLVFRIRRKSSGYIWIECTGRLHVEAGKGRKAVILSGRAISVPTLPWSHISQNGGLSETEAWMKVSFEGLILHSTSGINDLIGLSTDGVVGESIFSLLPNDGSSSSTSASIAHLASSLRAAASPSTRTATTFRHQLYHHKRKTAVDVVSVIYPSKSSEIRASSADSDGGSPASDTSRPTSSSSFSLNGQRPTSLVVQIKLAHSTTPSRPIVHSGLSNVFEELETTRGTSWQYELHQLRLLNRRIKDDIAAAKAKGAKPGKSKKRKDESGTGGTTSGSMGPPPQPIPEQYNAAPRHQLAPGFGLVAPGKSPFYQ